MVPLNTVLATSAGTNRGGVFTIVTLIEEVMAAFRPSFRVIVIENDAAAIEYPGVIVNVFEAKVI